MSFGAGTHACVGAELDGGLEQIPTGHLQKHFGTVAIMAHALLSAGGRRDPDNLPLLDPNSERKHFSSYPVLFELTNFKALIKLLRGKGEKWLR